MGDFGPPSPLSDNHATDELTVDVFHPAHAGPARLGRAAERARTERQTVRHLFELREFVARQEARGLRERAQLVDADTSLHRPEDRAGACACGPGRRRPRLRRPATGRGVAPAAPTQPRLPRRRMAADTGEMGATAPQLRTLIR